MYGGRYGSASLPATFLFETLAVGVFPKAVFPKAAAGPSPREQDEKSWDPTI